MGYFSELWFLGHFLDSNVIMDPDLFSLMRTATTVRQTVLRWMHFRFKSSSGRLNCSQAGIVGLNNFYHPSQLETCLQNLVPLCAQLEHGRVTLIKEMGFADSVQSMKCTHYPLVDSKPNVPQCHMNTKCACRFFKADDDYTHFPQCDVPETLEGYKLSLDTLSRLMTRLQGEVAIHGQQCFDMWHKVLDLLDDCIVVVDGAADYDRRHEGPAVYHMFEFDSDTMQVLFSNPDDHIVESVRSEPVNVYHKTHGKCKLHLDLEVIDEGLLFEASLLPEATGKEIPLVGRYRPDVDNETGIRPKCEMFMFSSSEVSAFSFLDQDLYHYIDETGAQCEMCLLRRNDALYPRVKDALCRGLPLPMLISIVEQ
eukprot:TRINITY_DN25245_c0_g2_i1.p1 TRINITY_DN25245_c0_g2~~TRINITY_DN25245_c0_g2_i1.p1  ORF type:complete len:368 (+),score=27.80 TRINITY_DN25245_c0_g2_i1:167-1270(+)